MTGLFLRRGYRVKLLVEILDACECRGVQAPGMGWPTKQSFHNIAILGFLHLHVCSLIYRFEDCLIGGAIVCCQSSGWRTETNPVFKGGRCGLKRFGSYLMPCAWRRLVRGTNAGEIFSCAGSSSH